MKKKEENFLKKKKEAPPEKFWQSLVDVYFGFYRDRFRDEDGFRLSPDWSPQKRGMEAKGLKGIISFLRGIAEGKKQDWTEEHAKYRLEQFLEKAYDVEFYKKNFYCALLNKKKVDIITRSFNPELVKKILECWYLQFPDYARDFVKDKEAGGLIVDFIKQQFLFSNLQITDAAIVATAQTIFKKVNEDDWWRKKSLKSIANNIQEFVNKIKSDKNGGKENFRNHDGRSTPTSNSKIRAIKEWGLSTDTDNG